MFELQKESSTKTEQTQREHQTRVDELNAEIKVYKEEYEAKIDELLDTILEANISSEPTNISKPTNISEAKTIEEFDCGKKQSSGG